MVIHWHVGDAIREQRHSMNHFSGNGVHLLRSRKPGWWSVTFVFILESGIERASFRPNTQICLHELLDVIRMHIRELYKDEFLKQVQEASAIIALCRTQPKS